MRTILFADAETTGLNPEIDQIWEFAAIERTPAADVEHHWYVQHDKNLCQTLPESFRADHERRFDDSRAVSQQRFAQEVHALTEGATIVGAIPSFDTGFLTALYREHGLVPNWHYRLRCIESMATGYMGREVNGLAGAADAFDLDFQAAHTAMGDVQMTRRLYDIITTPAF